MRPNADRVTRPSAPSTRRERHSADFARGHVVRTRGRAPASSTIETRRLPLPSDALNPTAHPSPGRRSSARQARALLLGALFGVVAVGLRASLQPVLGNELPFVIAFPAIVVSAVLLGSVGGAATTLICAAAVASPAIAPNLPPDNRPLQIGAFLVGSIVVALFCGRLAARRGVEILSSEPDAGFESPLTSWLRAVLWGAFLVPATAFVIIAWWGYERAAHDAEANVAHACELAWRQAVRTFAVTADIARRADLAAAGSDEAVRSREAEIHRRLADMTSGLPSVVNLNVWDAGGRPLVRSDIFPVDPNAIVADRQYFQDQRAKASPLGISEPIIGRQSGRELFNATIRRSASDGRFTGLVSVSLAPDFFRDYYQSLASEQQSLENFVLARLDGTVLTRWPKADDDMKRLPADSQVMARIAAGDTRGTLIAPPGHGQEARIISFRRVEGFPLIVIARVGRGAMLASWTRFVALVAGILLPTAAGLVYVSWVALKKTRREAATAAALQEQVRRRASAERSLLQTQKLETLAVVTGGVAHDFNNLLAIVTASLHILQRRHPDLAREKHMQAMNRAVQTGVRLTRQLLSFTRKQALRPETLLLQTWLPANEGLFQSTLGSTVSWQLSIDPGTLPITVDVGELELALINLVVNARHAMPDGGTLALAVGNAPPAPGPAPRPRVVLAIRDSGVGIPPDLLDKVVEPFFTTRAKGAGSGLGLSQVQGFCTEAGGELRIASAVGLGTTVEIFVPAAAQTALPEPPELRAPAVLRGRVLLVEDNEDVGATTETMLRAAGLEPMRRLDADAALAYLAATAELPDVVLSDISMPGSMNGIDFALTLKRRHPELPVLLTTGYTEQLDKAVASGLRVLPKPVAPEDLLAELATLLAKKVGDTAH